MGWTFSGDGTADPHALTAFLKRARSVRITAGGCLVYAVDPVADVLDPATEKHVVLMQDEPLAHVSDERKLAELQQLLVVVDFDNFICMCPGDLAFEFLDSRGDQITVVRFDKPGWLDWPLWEGRGRPRNIGALQDWLRAQGIDERRVAD